MDEVKYIPTKDQIEEQEAEDEIGLRTMLIQMLEERKPVKQEYHEMNDNIEIIKMKIANAVSQKFQRKAM